MAVVPSSFMRVLHQPMACLATLRRLAAERWNFGHLSISCRSRPGTGSHCSKSGGRSRSRSRRWSGSRSRSCSRRRRSASTISIYSFCLSEDIVVLLTDMAIRLNVAVNNSQHYALQEFPTIAYASYFELKRPSLKRLQCHSSVRCRF